MKKGEKFVLSSFYQKFPTELACHKYLKRIRWGKNVVCPKCSHGKTYAFKDNKRWKCAGCKQQFTVRIGTIFERSPLPLQQWFMVIYLATSAKNGISSIEVSKHINVTQKTAWFMLQRIRSALGNEEASFTGEIEVDETYFGGKNKNRHLNERLLHKEKVPILGILERGESSKVKTKVLNDVSVWSVRPILRKQIDKEAHINTDQSVLYTTLSREGYSHGSVDHSAHQYVNGSIHTNTIEGFWSLLKRGTDGTYHHISPKHLQRYCNEFQYRYNTRRMVDSDRFQDSLNPLTKYTLRYKNLISEKDYQESINPKIVWKTQVDSGYSKIGK